MALPSGGVWQEWEWERTAKRIFFFTLHTCTLADTQQSLMDLG